MPKIRDLITFEKIKDVIDIDTITDHRSMVEKYVISPAIEEYLVELCQDFNRNVHKAVQVVGGYGSGKSHLLAFIISILTEPQLRQYIQNDKVRAAAMELQREFAVVFWELQPNDVELSAFFYDKIETQLKENYGIQVSINTTGLVDHKQNVLEILEQVKQDNPTRGLVVIFDEVSDFLKQKTKEKINRDMQFLRVLGQMAQACDFTFIGAMQEHIFSNHKYVDEAESFGRVAERFQVITIKREDIKRVISRRVLAKSPEQRLQLEKLFADYTRVYPYLQANLDEYIELFPLHPYVIQVFSELPYFEKRGVIQFTIQEVERILDEDFPCLITYNSIFDEMESKHTVKNLETVSPVVNAVSTLDSKIDLLERRQQDAARKIVKALAVLKLYGKTNNNGATVQELANTLLLLPGNRALEASDSIRLVLNRLRRVTDGQFINVNAEGYYYLDLDLQIDYEQVIERRTDNLPDGVLDEEILNILKEQLLLGEEISTGVFCDSCPWPGRRSFREGNLIYEMGKGEVADRFGDYQVVLVSPFCHHNRYNATENRLVIHVTLDADTIVLLKRTAAAKQLVRDNFQKSVMERKYARLRADFIEALVDSYLETGQVSWGTNSKSIKGLIAREFSNFDELFSEVKPMLLEPYFEKKYPQHPRFTQLISRDNIRGEFSQAIKDILNRNETRTTFSSSRSILGALDLINDEGNLNTVQSEVAVKIMEMARKNQGKMIDVQDVIEAYSQSPYGYDRLMTAFVLVILTFNGELILRAAGGKVISSAEVGEVFIDGLDAFDNVKYLTLESDINPQPLIDLFIALSITPAAAAKLRVSSKRGEAVQDFRTRYLEIKEQCNTVKMGLDKVSMLYSRMVDTAGLNDYHGRLAAIPLEQFEQVKTPSHLQRIVYKPEKIKSIGEAYMVLQSLNGFYDKFLGQIASELDYALQVKQVVERYPHVFRINGLEQLMEDAFNILTDAGKLLQPASLNPLLGKLQQVKRKYQGEYYRLHQMTVGDEVDWDQLDKILQSKNYQKIKQLKNVYILPKDKFNRIEAGIANVTSLRCFNFRVEQLSNQVLCPYCRFPEDFGQVDVVRRIDAIKSRVDEVAREWESTILTELEKHEDKLPYLTAEEQNQVTSVIGQGQLPTVVSSELIKALNNLFKDLELIEINPEAFFAELFKDSPVLDYEGFARRLEELKQQIAAGKELDKVRIQPTGREVE